MRGIIGVLLHHHIARTLPRCELGWRLGRVYFLAFLNPSRGQPDPALTARLASPVTVDEPMTELD